jgi:hypothetical protein
MNAIRAKLREATGRDKMDHAVSYVVMTLNLILRGWKAYFRNGTSTRKFSIIDNYIHERPRRQGVAGAIGRLSA